MTRTTSVTEAVLHSYSLLVCTFLFPICGALQRVMNSHLVHSMVLHPPGGRCCFWLAAGSKRTESSRHAMIVWGRWSPPVVESKDSQQSSAEGTVQYIGSKCIFVWSGCNDWRGRTVQHNSNKVLSVVFVCFARVSFKQFFLFSREHMTQLS